MTLSTQEFFNTKKILVGSLAVNRGCEGSHPPIRHPKDVDYLLRGTDKKYFSTTINGTRIDAHGIPESIFDYILNFCQKDHFFTQGGGYVPPLNILYTLKVSHAQFDIHWDKTMFDINWFQEQGCIVDKVLYDQLYKFWLDVHHNHKNKINLNKTNEDFFTDGVKRIYIHDDLHEAMKYQDKPMYQILKRDPSKAMISKQLFDMCHPSQQFQLCREEIYVTALERFHIPYEGKFPPIYCYRKAIKKLVTSMTKGWFPYFIITNFSELKTPDKDYVEIFKEARKKGLIRKL